MIDQIFKAAAMAVLASFIVTVTPATGAMAGESGSRTAAFYTARGKAEIAPSGRRILRKRRRIQYAPVRRITAPVRVSCLVEKGSGGGGSSFYPIIRIINTGAGTIPTGSRFRWRLSTGKYGGFTLSQAVPPGRKSPAIEVPYHKWLDGLTCRASTI